LEVVLAWSTPVLHLLNASFAGDAPTGEIIERGTTVGTWNKRPMTSSLRLKAFQGTLIAAVAFQKRAAAAA
jgi:hypothetical protein